MICLQERELLECIKRQLQCKIDESFEHLCVLQDVRQQIVTDLQNKNITLEIDVDQYNLTIDSNGVTFKPNPTRAPKGYVMSPCTCTCTCIIIVRYELNIFSGNLRQVMTNAMNVKPMLLRVRVDLVDVDCNKISSYIVYELEITA